MATYRRASDIVVFESDYVLADGRRGTSFIGHRPEQDSLVLITECDSTVHIDCVIRIDDIHHSTYWVDWPYGPWWLLNLYTLFVPHKPIPWQVGYLYFMTMVPEDNQLVYIPPASRPSYRLPCMASELHVAFDRLKKIDPRLLDNTNVSYPFTKL